MKVLAGDIGGTKSLLALFEVDGRRIRTAREERFESRAYADLPALVRAFMSDAGGSAEAACFAVAGPVVGDTLCGPNLTWSIRIGELGEAIGLPRTTVINDFCAVGHALDRLDPSDLAVLQTGQPQPEQPIGLIGAGTGLGEAYLTWQGDCYEVHASEGGHCDFAPADRLQRGLYEHLRARYEHVSYERVVSGPGLVDTYRYLVETDRAPGSASVAAEMEEGDAAEVVSRHALAGDDEACAQALDLFLSVYGAEAGNLALKILATGGVYLAGGIAAKILVKLQDGPFLDAFRSKGRHADLLQTIPVSVILTPRAGLLGAARVATELLG